MRLRACVLACALAMLGCLTVPSLAAAAPKHDHDLTIAAVPNPILAGEAVLIFGRLQEPNNSGQLIRLYHHLDGSGRGFTLVTTTTTNASGEYEFLRPEGLVYNNRDWFVRGPDGAHSRMVDERVAALVTLNPATHANDTSHPVLFTGHVTPNHTFERVFLQKQDGSSDDWSTIATRLIGPGSNYLIVHRFRIPGAYDLRVLFKGDARNARSPSDPVNLVIQQAQVPGFTITTSAPIVGEGGQVTISGVLSQPKGQSTIVQLWGRTPDNRFEVLDDGTTQPDGSYSFTRSGLSTNTVYYVATMPMRHSPRRHTARLYEGVRDAVTTQANSTGGSTGQTVTFTGTVLPDKAGHVIYLQRLGRDGDWHRVEIGFVRNDSSFRFTWTLGSPGRQAFRARITSDEDNRGSASPPVTITVTAPQVSTLPPAS